MKHNEYLSMSAEGNVKARNQKCCHACICQFEEGEQKCGDHDHGTGQLRGMAHVKKKKLLSLCMVG